MSETSHTPTCWFHHGFRALYEDKRLCDIEIHVQDNVFTCHRVVLIAASKYFDIMFSSGLKEAGADVIHIKEVSANIFGDILSFIYSGEIHIDTDNVEALLHASCCFQIHPLKDKCEHFLMGHITSENGVGLWCIARAYSCEKLTTKTYNFVLDNFDQIVRHDEILKVDFEDMLKVVSDNNLRVENEETVCNVALRWINHDIEGRQKYFVDILPEFRLFQISMEYLLEKLLSNAIIRQSDKCIDILKSAIKYHTMPEMRHTISSLKTRIRTSSNKVALTLVLGKRKSEEYTEVIGYSDTNRKWVTLCLAPIETGDGLAACPVGNDVYVSGGTKKPNSVYQFSAKLFRWIEKAPMMERRSKHSMVAVGNSVYAIGGYNFHTIGSVEEFDMNMNMWTSVGKLTHAVAGTSATVLAGNIYIFGGWHGLSEETSIIQCYNPITNQCTVVGKLPSPHMDTRALTVENKTYVVGTGGEVYLFEEDYKVELVNKITDFNKKDFGLFSENGSLFCLGGENFDNIDSDGEEKDIHGIEIINAFENGACAESLPNKLPVPFEVYCCYKSVLVPKYPIVSFSDDL